MAPDNVVHSPMAAAAEAALDSLEADSPSNNTPGFATPGAVESYLKLMREAGISDPTRATKEGDHAPSPTSFKTAAPADPVPVAGYYGRPGEQLGTAEEARKIYEEQGWLPAVTGPYEEDRRRVLERYSLPHATKNEQIDRIADTAQCVFSVPIVVVSLVLEDRETFVCTLGWDAAEREEDFPRISIPLDAALCPHRMVVNEGDTEHPDCLILPDAGRDWRFKQNPYVRDGGPITFFASTNIYLPTGANPSCSNSKNAPKPPPRLPVGSLCIVDRVARSEDFGPEKQLILRSLAGMIGREFELARERRITKLAALQTTYTGDLFRSQMIYLSGAKSQAATPTFHNDVAAETAALLKADTFAIIDLRSFNTPLPPATEAIDPPSSMASTDNRRPAYVRQQSGHTSIRSQAASAEWYSSSLGKEARVDGSAGTVSVMGCSGYDWASKLRGAAAAISHFFITYYSYNNSTFDSSTTGSPLGDLLPPQAQASLAVPIFDVSGEPALLLVACSYSRYFSFESTDRAFVENVGAILMSSLLRKRIVDADRAKLAFVSQISHELRTPLHGIGSQVELIRAVCPPSLEAIEPLLSVADVCVASLREVLDNTLEHSKMQHSVHDESFRPPALTEVDLENLVEEVVKSCWSRGRQRATAMGERVRGDVAILLDVQLSSGRFAAVDVGGLKRVLFNIIGNSLKFTDEGSVTITVEELHEVEGVAITVADTGRGMSESFLKEELFMPFRQADAFGSGAGLGVSISDAIVRRMNGTLRFASALGVGTTASISLPVRLTAAIRPSLAPSSIRTLSEELSALFKPLAVAEHIHELDEARSKMGTPRPVPELTPACTPVATSPQPPEPSTADQDDDVFRVLIADDNPIGLRILATFLRTRGIAYSEASNGAEAVELFNNARYAVALLDVQMPVMSGIEASLQMRELEMEHGWPRARIVAISGLSSELGSHARLLRDGTIDQWLTKGGPTLKTLAAGLNGWQEEFHQRRLAWAKGSAVL